MVTLDVLADFLNFSFGGKPYEQQVRATWPDSDRLRVRTLSLQRTRLQLLEAISKTKSFCAVHVERRSLNADGSFGGSGMPLVFVAHNFGFIGGSLGCAEGEKVTRAFEYATQNKLPIVVVCRTGGARMQEGALSLMQMAKVSVAVRAHADAGLPFVSVLEDPTYAVLPAPFSRNRSET